MSAKAVVENATKPELLFLAYTDLIVNPELAIRTSNGAKRELSDEDLKASLLKYGQIQPCKVRKTDVGVELTAGHRRAEQIGLINMEMGEDTPERLKSIMCITGDATDDEAFGQAAAENLKRLDMNGIEKANLCGMARERFGWKGKKGDQKVADFLGVSRAWVTQAEKLLTLPAEIQAMIESGDVTEAGAWELLKVQKDSPEKLAQVVAGAKAELEAEEGTATDGDVIEGVIAGKKSGGKKKKKAVGAKHVRNAKEKVDDPNKKPKPTAKAIAGFFDSYRLGNENGIPFAYQLIQDFTVYFVDKFCEGKGTVETASKKYEAMIAGACKGAKVEMPKEEKAVTKVVTAAPGKTKTKKKAGK